MTINMTKPSSTVTTLLHRDNILSEINLILKEQGFAGNTSLPKLVFLSAVSRLFPDPVNLVVTGPSGSGKTHSIESGLQFIAPSDIERLSGMSEKALVYASDLDLKHRILYLGEAAGMSEGNGRVFLRQLLTEGSLNYLTVQKTNAGMKGERTSTIEGPLCFMMATTANHIYHEDQTRMLMVSVSEDPKRVRAALMNQAIGKTKKDVDFDRTSWYELQDHIRDQKRSFDIPYAADLAYAMPVEHFRIQRDFPKLIALIQAHTLIHFKTRETNSDGELVATRADYEAVYPLIKDPLDQGLERSVSDSVREVIDAVRKLTVDVKGPESYSGVSQTKVAELIGRDRSVVSRNAAAAINLGYLVNATPGAGRTATLQLGERKVVNRSVLPTPDELFANGASSKMNW